jgi:hypothetical protein
MNTEAKVGLFVLVTAVLFVGTVYFLTNNGAITWSHTALIFAMSAEWNPARLFCMEESLPAKSLPSEPGMKIRPRFTRVQNSLN